jgi:hypothetical protein
MPLIHPLQSLHEQAEATFLPYGPEVRIVESYGTVEAEYAAIRKGVALMDAPHRAVAILTGKDRLAFLHNKVTNDINRLQPGQGCCAYLLNLKGRIFSIRRRRPWWNWIAGCWGSLSKAWTSTSSGKMCGCWMDPGN